MVVNLLAGQPDQGREEEKEKGSQDARTPVQPSRGQSQRERAPREMERERERGKGVQGEGQRQRHRACERSQRPIP